MNFPRIYLMAAVLMALGLSSCASYQAVFAPPSPAPGTRVNWPVVNYKEVRAFCYDYTADKSPSFFINGVMHKGVMDPKGVKLTPTQTQQLLTALTISQGKQDRTPCYKPHHAFVFYDADDNVAAVFEMCFGCNKFVATPGVLPEYINYDALWKLTGELGLPLGKGNEFYTDSVCRYRASH